MKGRVFDLQDRFVDFAARIIPPRRFCLWHEKLPNRDSDCDKAAGGASLQRQERLCWSNNIHRLIWLRPAGCFI